MDKQKLIKYSYYVNIDYGICQYLGKSEYKGDIYYTFKFRNQRYSVTEKNLNDFESYDNRGKRVVLSIYRNNNQQWKKTKAQAIAKARKQAQELLKVYAKRMQNAGVTYDEDTGIQRQFENSFEFEFTQGQKDAIAEIKQDMEQGKLMERLLIGDVGYGKTLVAEVIAFKVVQNHKQVAILAPTQVLAEQHFENFKEEMNKFGVKIGYLTGDTKAKERRRTLELLKNKELDILIGTQAILGNKVIYNDIGLLIIDEEQKFGTVVKDKIKKYKGNVNIISMTATPIPRTYHLAETGIIDITQISTPPSNKKPVITDISVWDDNTIKGTIQRELNRNGQIYFLYNNIERLEELKKHLLVLFPDIRIGIKHSEMTNKESSFVMRQFNNKELDLLLCTTVIEVGTNVLNANTIIIYEANKLGCGQIHQLRGRVGRNGSQGYCLLVTNPKDTITAEAKNKLLSIKEHTELGAGIELAKSDALRRGFGETIGVKQAGKIPSIGYDMYMRLLKDEVVKEKRLLSIN